MKLLKYVLIATLALSQTACKSTNNESKGIGKDPSPTQPPVPEQPSDTNPQPQPQPGSGDQDSIAVLAPRSNFKVAFVGDQGNSDGTTAVLNLIKSEKTDLVIIPGDFDYNDDPDAWDQMLQSTIGNTPVFAAMGNHDKGEWPGYEAKLKTRLDNAPLAKCSGTIGVQQKCVYAGVVFAITAMGMTKDDHAKFIDETFTSTPALFKVCVWHYNQTKMQVGDKSDQAGWDGYETCRKHGAAIITAHEHSYSRTHLMSDIKNQVMASNTNHLILEPGKSFVTVSGLGGKSIRAQERNDPWWAKIYTSNQDAKEGALFCTYHIENNPRKAKCVFKNVAGEIIDDYTVESRLQK